MEVNAFPMIFTKTNISIGGTKYAIKGLDFDQSIREGPMYRIYMTQARWDKTSSKP